MTEKTFMEKWRDFWFWFDGVEFLLICVSISTLMLSVTGSLVLLRSAGLV